MISVVKNLRRYKEDEKNFLFLSLHYRLLAVKTKEILTRTYYKNI